MPSWLVKLGALTVLAQTISAAELHIRTTDPPANNYVEHCTVILNDELFGCKGSSKPFPNECGQNYGVETKSICDTMSVTINWDTALVMFDDNKGNTANCTLSSVETEGHCNTDNSTAYPVEANNAVHLSAGTALWGLGTMALGLFL
ncbi:hypothetical protein BO70DRAFT_303072 [Aspergillus heteromorphus CBS 117.55]|uniref:Uncharacterized protein n=1 Tax=Aspergillus heteromorphus CBS 117.55 TaxID=1448321 RepID=A0A317UQI3_9EURO|nr:uncharacterized protein BO70DRAFT_303072 [Aspergillus heteromorphus CBS 117.55]PWY64263.1 hypothetical protein BO70DRAFT_303072 [Aspergillus heteromorphus CBS 117.55]